MKHHANKAIRCSVNQCANHSGNEYCALESITVGTHEPEPMQVQCTDCESFERK